jgi:molecular chaperone GrpE
MSGDTPLAPDAPTPPTDLPGGGGAEAVVRDAEEAPTPDTAPDQPAAPSPAGAAPTGGSGEAPDRAAELEERLAALQAEHESLRSQYLRIAADFENFRKRQSRDHDDLRQHTTSTTLSEILPVVDNFDRARQQLNPQHEEAQAVHRNYQLIYKQLVDVFKQLGVSPMRVEGEPFDPRIHEAVLREPNHDHAEDMVVEELQRGYHINGRVLRHAMVKVSAGPGPTGTPQNIPAEGEEQTG